MIDQSQWYILPFVYVLRLGVEGGKQMLIRPIIIGEQHLIVLRTDLLSRCLILQYGALLVFANSLWLD